MTYITVNNVYGYLRKHLIKFSIVQSVLEANRLIRQRWSRGHKARGQGHKKNPEAKDSLSEDRHSRGQGQECSRPRTQAQVLSKKKKRSSQKFFRRSPKKKRSSQKFFKRSPQKNVLQKIFQAFHKILTIQKILLSLNRGQANFRGLEASRPRTSKCVLEDSTSVIRHVLWLT